MTYKIALLGTGAMGLRLGQQLLAAGYALTVYNRTPERAQPLVERGAELASSPRAAAAVADMLISLVRDDAASQQVWLRPHTGAALGLRPGTVAMESSTLSLGWTHTLAAELGQRGVHWLDAPVVGSRPQADAGALIYLVGGTPTALAMAQPVLATLGQTIHHVGSTGAGMAMKLAVNTLFALQVAGLAEMVQLLSGAELSPEIAWATLSQLPVISPALRGVGGLMVSGHHAPQFPIALVAKDLAYAQAAAQAADHPADLVTSTHDLYYRAAVQGHGDLNISGIGQVFGVRPSPAP